MQVAETPWICIAAVDAMSFIFSRREIPKLAFNQLNCPPD
jgi:hypothetical protein